MKKAITVTILFEADALNRDEKVAGNILSIKKLTRGWGETYSFISRPAIRHCLWVTLNKSNPERWKEAPVRKAEGNVIQFDLEKGNIKDFAELDIFGYMTTQRGERRGEGEHMTRKSPLGITKAVSLEPWVADMAFYANHDLVRRYIKENPEERLEPNPYNKEEQYSLYKVSFTLDCLKVGKDDKGDEIDPKEKQSRIFDILNAIYNGLYYHSSGECPGIVPLFLIAGIVKVPIPIFHSFVDIEFYKHQGKPKFMVRQEFLENSLSNGWLEEGYNEKKERKRLIFIKANEPGALSEDFVKKYSITSDWEMFIKTYLFEESGAQF